VSDGEVRRKPIPVLMTEFKVDYRATDHAHRVHEKATGFIFAFLIMVAGCCPTQPLCRPSREVVRTRQLVGKEGDII